ncbi:hypothetical protein ACJX0J_040009, partial [Zea mays]
IDVESRLDTHNYKSIVSGMFGNSKRALMISIQEWAADLRVLDIWPTCQLIYFSCGPCRGFLGGVPNANGDSMTTRVAVDHHMHQDFSTNNHIIALLSFSR